MDLPLLDLLLVLVAAFAAGRVPVRLGFPSVLGELAAGILLGPPLLGLLSGHPALDALAQLGIILMMLYIGMEIDPAEMRKAAAGGFLAAIGGFISPFVLCYLLIVGAGGTIMEGVFVGIAVGVTSLATKSRILSDLRLLDTRIAHVMMSGALIADTISLVIFAGIVGLAEAGSLQVDALTAAFGKAVVFFLVAFATGRYAFPWLGKKLGGSGRGTVFPVVVLIGLLFAEGAHIAGMHGILGAFVAGLFLRDSVLGRSLRTEVMDLVQDASVRFLAPIFFVTAGFAVSFDVVVAEPGLLIAVIGLATVGKILGTALFYLPTGHGWREGLVLGASMNGRGAVEIIIAQIGLSMGLISQEIFSILVFMAIATTATVPIFLKLGTDWLRRHGQLVRTDESRSGTLVVGAGPLARMLAGTLGGATLVDRNRDHCESARNEGFHAILGDALDERVLAEAGASSVRAFVALTGNPEVDVLAARLARDPFTIPEIYLPSYQPENDAHGTTTRHLGARTLFGMPLNTNEWDYRIEETPVEVVTETLARAQEAAAVVTGARRAGPVVVLTSTKGGLPEPFHAETRLTEGDELTLVRASGFAPSDLMGKLCREASVVDLSAAIDFEEFLALTSSVLAPQVGRAPDRLTSRMREREYVSSTVLERGIAVPHVRLDGEDTIALALARSREGFSFPGEPHPVHASFVLATTDDRRRDHLRALASIARIVSDDTFMPSWLSAPDGETLRTLVTQRLGTLEAQQRNR